MRNHIVFFLAIMALAQAAFAGLVKDQMLVSGGIQRSFDLYLPDSILNNTSQQPRPLVLLLHGHGGDADGITGENGRSSPYKAWFTIADREGLLLVIPDGEVASDGYRGWNDCRQDAQSNPSTDDVAFLNALVDQIAQQYPVDKRRVYANGTSNGGNMVYRLAQESADRYRAVAAVVAAMPVKNDCSHMQAPVPVLIMNGTDDPILPYAGGAVGRRESDKQARGSVLSTKDSVAYWLANNGIQSEPVVKDYPDIVRRDRSQVHVRQYLHGKKNSEVILYEIRGGGHTEPSLTEHYGKLYKLIVGPQNMDIEMAEEVWAFFNRHR